MQHPKQLAQLEAHNQELLRRASTAPPAGAAAAAAMAQRSELQRQVEAFQQQLMHAGAELEEERRRNAARWGGPGLRTRAAAAPLPFGGCPPTPALCAVTGGGGLTEQEQLLECDSRARSAADGSAGTGARRARPRTRARRARHNPSAPPNRAGRSGWRARSCRSRPFRPT